MITCDLFSDIKYGFTSSRSTADLLKNVSNRIARTIYRSRATRAVAIDTLRASHRVWGGGKRPTTMKLGTVVPYLKKIQKMHESLDTTLSSADVFLPEISKFCYIKKYRYRFILVLDIDCIF